MRLGGVGRKPHPPNSRTDLCVPHPGTKNKTNTSPAPKPHPKTLAPFQKSRGSQTLSFHAPSGTRKGGSVLPLPNPFLVPECDCTHCNPPARDYY